jgi:basic membrane protein A
MPYQFPDVVRRRTLLRGLLAAGAFSATSQFWASCSTSTINISTPVRGNESDRPLSIGVIYEGAKDDFGYSQSHAEAMAKIAAQLPHISVVEEARVPETAAAKEAMRSMIEQDGANLIFATSYGYFDPHVLELAIEFPQVQFFCPAQSLSGNVPPNVGTYFCYLIEPAFLTGMVAASMTQTGRLGVIIPKPIPAVIQDINSFVLGARSIDPNIPTQAIVTGEWNSPIKEAEAANSLIDQSVDVILPRVDNAKVVANIAQNRNIFYCGFHVNQADLAPEHFLTGVEWNWQAVYAQYVELIQAGNTLMNGGIPRTLIGGLRESFSEISPYGINIPTEVQMRVEAAKNQLISGERVIFEGGLKDNQGNLLVPDHDALKLGDPRLNSLDRFVEGITLN